MAKKELLEKQRLAREAGEPIPVSPEEEEEEEDLDAKFALPEEFQKYTGSEMDRSGFLRWKKKREEAQRYLAEQCRAYEAEKLKQERERKRIEKAELMKGELAPCANVNGRRLCSGTKRKMIWFAFESVRLDEIETWQHIGLALAVAQCGIRPIFRRKMGQIRQSRSY